MSCIDIIKDSIVALKASYQVSEPSRLKELLDKMNVSYKVAYDVFPLSNSSFARTFKNEKENSYTISIEESTQGTIDELYLLTHELAHFIYQKDLDNIWKEDYLYGPIEKVWGVLKQFFLDDVDKESVISTVAKLIHICSLEMEANSKAFTEPEFRYFVSINDFIYLQKILKSRLLSKEDLIFIGNWVKIKGDKPQISHIINPTAYLFPWGLSYDEYTTLIIDNIDSFIKIFYEEYLSNGTPVKKILIRPKDLLIW